MPTAIDYATARTLAEAEIRRNDTAPEQLAILDDFTKERPYGWVFHYGWRPDLPQSRDPAKLLLGNAPILVTRTGVVHVLGTAWETEWYLRNFEETGDPHRVSAAVETAERAEARRQRTLQRAVAETLRTGWPALQRARGKKAQYALNATTGSVRHLLETQAPEETIAAHLAAAEAQWLGTTTAADDVQTLAQLAARLRLVTQRIGRDAQ